MESANVLLLSGGVDSVSLLHKLTESGEALQALFIDYGQRGARHEHVAAQHFCEPLGVELVRFDLSTVGETFRNVQARKAHIPLPHRNLVALALGVSYAANLGARKLYLAVTQEDALTYSSASHPFLAQFRLLIGLIGEVTLSTPYIDLTKAEVIRRGTELGIDYSMAYSCMVGHPVHCGRCRQCSIRRAAFAEAGHQESADFYRV